jgi:hypothetical protein
VNLLHKISESLSFYDKFLEQERSVLYQYSLLKGIMSVSLFGFTVLLLHLMKNKPIQPPIENYEVEPPREKQD